MKASRVPPMTLQEYTDWINGTSKKVKRSGIKEPTLKTPTWAITNDHIKSVKPGTHIAVRSTIMERALMGKESLEVTQEILNKSKRIGLMYSKGTYGYITDRTDVKDLGKKNPTM